jgi:Pectate lyase superfamily protein
MMNWRAFLIAAIFLCTCIDTHAADLLSLQKISATAAANPEAASTKQPWADVRAFGAKGDGETDDTRAILAAIEYARGLNNIVYFSPGSYKITAPLRIPPNVHLEGVGMGFGSVLRPIETEAIVIDGRDWPAFNNHTFRVTVKGLTIMMNKAPAFKAIRVEYAYNVVLQEVLIHDAAEGGGIRVFHSAHVALRDMILNGTGEGKGVGLSIKDADVKLYNPDIEGFWDGLVVEGDAGTHVFGGYFERNSSYAVKFIGAKFNTVIGARIATANRQTVAIGFWAAGAGGAPSEHNTIIGCHLDGLGGAGAVYQDRWSHDNMLMNTYVHGGIIRDGNTALQIQGGLVK